MTTLVRAAEQRLDAMIEDLAVLVDVESPSSDPDALARSADAVAELLERRTGVAAELVHGPAGPHVRWSGGGSPRVLLLGHHDTVFPHGTLAQRPFALADGVATGPGVFDMKAGLVQAAHAIALLDDPSAVELLVTCDEEVGSATSRELVEARARAAGAVLVLEPSAPGGALKTARKGNGTFEVVIRGRAAHAGLEPERGVSALVEAAVQVLHLTELGRADLGTTVTPTVLRAGTADNVVPAEAVLRVDARIVELDERDRVEAAMRALHPHLEGAEVDVRGGITRPPMPAAMSTELFARACRAAEALDLPPLEGVAVGGASDGNFTAAIGIPTLDGLGAVGGGAHADDEHVLVPTLPARTALLSTLVTDLTRA